MGRGAKTGSLTVVLVDFNWVRHLYVYLVTQWHFVYLKHVHTHKCMHM